MMIWKDKRNQDRKARARGESTTRRRCLPERLEERRLLAADPIHVGVVYLETDYLESDQDVGGDSRGDRFILSFTGGAPNTELSQLRIVTDKDGDGISVGDPIFDTAQGGRGKNGSHGFQIVRVQTSDGRQVDAIAEVDDGGQELILRLSNFRAGDRLEFTLDVDEVLRNAVDLAVFNDRLDVITSGQEFQDSILHATFDAPHYETTSADAVFLNDYGIPTQAHGLNLPTDEGSDIDSRPNRSAAAIASAEQVAKPVSVEGYVWIDNDLDTIREPGEKLLAGIELVLWHRDSDSGQYVDTNHRAITDAGGRYEFPKSLALQPGEYQVVQSQPAGLYSVAAVPGTVDGVPTGMARSSNVLSSIVIPLGDQSAIGYDFAEAETAELSGFVYEDSNDNGQRDASESGIAGVTVRLLPVQTIATQVELSVTTSADGSYSFNGLVPGSYEVIEVNQPADFDDGRDNAGMINGTIVGVADDPGDRIGQIELGGADVAIQYNFGEIPRGVLSGFVYLVAPGEDCNGIHDSVGNTPLGGVQVQLQTKDGTTVASTTTSGDGSYRFDSVSKGDYRITQVTPNGLIDGESHVGLINGLRVGESVGGGLIGEITMTAGAVGTQYNFCEAAPANMSGYVYRDHSNDGRRDSGESGIAGTSVALVDSENRFVAQTTTDANGRYEFVGVLPGEYSIVETQPSGFIDGIDSPGQVNARTVGVAGDDGDSIRAIVLRQGQSGVEYNFGELVGASLAGRVHIDIDGDCVIDPDESPLAGVTIRLLGLGGVEVARTTTDATGQYRFDNLVPSDYTVVEDQPAGVFEGDAKPGSAGGAVETPSRIGSISLSSGEVAVDYNFCERPGSEILGNVFNDADGDCIFEPGETGIEGVRVELYDDAGKLIASTQTDSGGNYQFTHLPAGSYSVRETQPAGWLQGGQSAGSHGGDDSVADVISRIPVGWGERLTNYNFCEVAPSGISGSVFVDANDDCIRDASERPLADVTVQLRDDSGNVVRTTTTDSDGRYSFNDLAPGWYEILEMQPDGYFHGGQSLGDGGGEILGADHMTLQLFAGRNVMDYNFCELEPASIAGGVWQEVDLNQTFDAGDIPIPGVMIDLIGESGRVVATTTTDTDGQYLFESLAPGVYSLREYQPDHLFHGGQNVGSLGGQVGGDDLIVAVQLRSGSHAVGYDFPEVPPATISGFVFQDGGSIVSFDPPPAEQLRSLRDGRLTEDDTLLVGVEIELRNVLGQPFDAGRALEGVYAEGPIRTTTDENGFYEFTGLRPGTYHVYQVQPDDFIDGLDTPGTTGGIAVNPADLVDDGDRIMIQTLASDDATDPRNDAILNISLAAGQASLQNNFSEVVIAAPPIPLPQASAKTVEPTKPIVPIETFHSSVRLVAYASPADIRTVNLENDEWAVSWHLSVINGGFPRGDDDEASPVEGVSAKSMSPNWTESDNEHGSWQLYDLEGNPVAVDEVITLGTEDSLALAGDFDGDGRDEAVIYAGGSWYVDMNGNGHWDSGDLWIQLGTSLDQPVVGDWDGDGKDDIAIFGRQWQRDPQRIKRDPGLPDPDNHRRRTVDVRQLVSRGEDRGEDRERLLRRGNRGELRADAVDHVFQYGESVDHPLSGDWNGDGIDQIAVFRSGLWLLDSDGDGRWTPRDDKTNFGKSGDEPIVGDFDGDGIDEIGVVRGEMWIIDTDGDRRLTGNDLHIKIPRPDADSQPVVGDWDGDGVDQPGYYDDAA